MNLILTMAGRYTRFINEGYRIPKYLLPWGDRSILSEIILELTKGGEFENIYLVANKRDVVYMPHVRRILKSLDISEDNLFLISDTSGQTETAYQGIQSIQNTFGDIAGPIVFHNIDTILYNRSFKDLPRLLDESDGFVDIFESSNHNYSYVLTKDGIVDTIAEKIVISDNASSGLYGFKSVESFLEYYSPEELYMSHLYQKMIKNGARITVSDMHTEKDTVVLGTPSEYLTAAYILDL